MKIKQISVFLENQSGRLNEVAQIMGQSGINLSAFTMAENADFGILRVIVSDPDKAMAVLKENKFAVSTTDVICLSCPDVAGGLAKALEIMSANGVAIDYMYAFSSGNGEARIIVRPTDIDGAIATLQNHKLELIAADVLYNL